jgi:glycosyltransferase involved in cell wall biosynthesis
MGAARNYQFLVERAQGEWIAYLDGDDFWQPGKLRAQLAFLRAHPTVVACYADAMAIGFDNSPVGVFSGPSPQEFDSAYLVEEGNFLCHGSMIYQRSARDVILGFSGPFIDYRIHLRLSRLGPLGFVNEVLAAYRVHVPNSMTARNPFQVRQLYWEALREACLELDNRPAVVRGLARFLGSAVVHGVLARQPLAARPWFASLRSTFPKIAGEVVVRSAVAAVALVFQMAWRSMGRKASGSSVRTLFPRRRRSVR